MKPMALARNLINQGAVPETIVLNWDGIKVQIHTSPKGTHVALIHDHYTWNRGGNLHVALGFLSQINTQEIQENAKWFRGLSENTLDLLAGTEIRVDLNYVYVTPDQEELKIPRSRLQEASEILYQLHQIKTEAWELIYQKVVFTPDIRNKLRHYVEAETELSINKLKALSAGGPNV